MTEKLSGLFGFDAPGVTAAPSPLADENSWRSSSFQHGGASHLVDTVRFDFGGGGLNLWDRVIASVLGYPVREGPGTLSRVDPIQHGVFKRLRAASISNLRGLSFTAKDKGTMAADYQTWAADIRYEQLPYPIGASEDEDYISKEWRPGVDLARVEGGKPLRWVTGVPAGVTALPRVGQPRRIPKMEAKFSWFVLPEDSVYNTDGIPTTLLSGIGRVNDNTYLGQDKAKWLLESATISRQLAGVNPTLMGQNAGKVPFIYRLDYNLILHVLATHWHLPAGQNWYQTTFDKNGDPMADDRLYEAVGFGAIIFNPG